MKRFRFVRAAAWLPLCAGISTLSFAAEFAGQRPPFATGEVDTIRVGADPSTVTDRIEDYPFFASVLDLEEANRRLLTVADVIEDAAGVRVRRYGSLGSFSTASIRGSSPGQVEIYLDGVPLNSAQWGITDLSELPLDNLASAAIYRSGAPAFLGTSGIGGVIELTTRPAGAETSALSITGGSYNTWKTSGIHSGSAGGAGYLISFRQLQSDGDFAFLYDPGTRFLNTEDDTVLTRRNNRLVDHAFLFKVASPSIAGWQFQLHDDWYLKESGQPGHGNLLYESASTDHRRHMISLSAHSPGFAGRRLKLDLTGFSLYRRDRYYNPAHETALARNDLTHLSRSDGGRGVLTWYWLEANQTWSFVAEERRENFLPGQSGGEGDAAPFERERERRNLAVENKAAFFRNRLTLLAAWRQQESEDNYFGPIPFGRPPEQNAQSHRSLFRGLTFGARCSPWGDVVSLRAARTEYARFPTLFEIFGTNGEVHANPELVPEEGTTWDVGASFDFADIDWPVTGRFDMSAYHSERDSLIYFIQNSQRSFVAKNLESAVARGLEFSTHLEIGKPLRFEGAFTTQEVRHRCSIPLWEEKWLPYISPREYFGRLSWRQGRFTVRYEYNYFDGYYRDRANTEEDRAEARAYHNAGARAEIRGTRMIVDFDVQNLSDNKTSDVFGYPLPGRTWYVTTQFNWNEQ